VKQPKPRFVCRECGSVQPKWVGRCPDCGTWDGLQEEKASSGPGRQGPGGGEGPVRLEAVRSRREARRGTGETELDRVLGGGLVEGQAVLLGGEPGIGKSTLLLQALGAMSREGLESLYVCAEESAEQVKRRASRLGVTGSSVFLLAETGMEEVLRHMASMSPAVTVIDSIQMMHLAEAPGAPGTVSQVRECAMAACGRVKQGGGAVFLVGHVTKEGSIAGPRVLEHVVDTVLHVEGERFQSYRLLRAVKNRFGPTQELGVFEMRGDGLAGVESPSALFLDRRSLDAPGGAVVACMEGRRPLLVEIQGLVAPSPYGTATRRSTGLDAKRLPMLLAVLERRGGLALGGHDVFVNAVGGVTVHEPAADLAAALALASSFLEKALPPATVVAGEVGLRGEIRPVSRTDARLRESRKLGFKRAILPAGSFREGADGLERFEVSDIKEALEHLEG